MIEQADKLNNQAILLASDGDFSSAIACYKRAITLDRGNYLLWYNLGVTYRDAGQLIDAKNALSTAYMIEPENIDVIETYGTLCIALKEYTTAQKVCIESLQQNPVNAHIWNLLGVVYFQIEAYDDSAECFEKAVYLDPFYSDALYNLSDTYGILKNTKGQAECENKIKEIGE